LFRGILFDIDGTLVDSNVAHAKAWSAALREHGFDIPTEDVLPLIGMGGDKLLKQLTGLSEETPEGKAISDRSSEVFDDCFLTGLRALPGARDLIVELKKRGLKIGAATSAGKKDTRNLLAQADVADLFDFVATSDDANESKPSPDIVAVAIEKAELPAEQVLMVGDTPYDVECARKNGVACVAVRSGGWSDRGLAGAIAVFDDTAAMLAHLDDPPLARQLGSGAADQQSQL
jgi:HAD superfamily hydrolase (TIGR01509 family)